MDAYWAAPSPAAEEDAPAAAEDAAAEPAAEEAAAEARRLCGRACAAIMP